MKIKGNTIFKISDKFERNGQSPEDRVQEGHYCIRHKRAATTTRKLTGGRGVIQIEPRYKRVLGGTGPCAPCGGMGRENTFRRLSGTLRPAEG